MLTEPTNRAGTQAHAPAATTGGYCSPQTSRWPGRSRASRSLRRERGHAIAALDDVLFMRRARAPSFGHPSWTIPPKRTPPPCAPRTRRAAAAEVLITCNSRGTRREGAPTSDTERSAPSSPDVTIFHHRHQTHHPRHPHQTSPSPPSSPDVTVAGDAWPQRIPANAPKPRTLNLRTMPSGRNSTTSERPPTT
jgi:hypothetical protein